MNWFKGLSLLWKAIVVALMAIFIFLAYNFVDDFFSKRAETEAKLATNQTEAAVQSGQDAVNTVTNQYTKEIERTHTVEVIKEKVNEAPDFHAAHTAGVDGLCVVSPDLCPQDPVQ